MKVLLTHSEGKLDGLEPILTRLNLNVIHRPAIKVNFINTTETLVKAKELLNLPWLFFSSRNAIEAWHKLGLPFKTKIGVVGKASAKILNKYNSNADLIAEPQNAKGLLASFLEHSDKQCPVGIVKGNISLDVLENGLKVNNCISKSVTVYETEPVKINEDADIVVLASPSAVKALPKNLSKAKLVAIGPSTAQEIENKGWQYQMATTPDINSIAKTIGGLL